jgi:hypothetical protein
MASGAMGFCPPLLAVGEVAPLPVGGDLAVALAVVAQGREKDDRGEDDDPNHNHSILLLLGNGAEDVGLE